MEEKIEKIEKNYKDMMSVINSTSLPLFVEDTIEDMHILIENLIKGYRELEEENKKWEEWAENAEYDMSVDYIPKSKVKEKIEEYQANMKKYEYADKNIFNENNIRQEVITVLTDLLMEDK